MNISKLKLPSSINTSDFNFSGDFFIPLLSNSLLSDRGVGFFSSGWFRFNATGMNMFAENGGRARWVTSPILSEDDWNAIVEGNEAAQDSQLFEILKRNIDELKSSLEEQTLSALSWLIADKVINIKLAVSEK